MPDGLFLQYTDLSCQPLDALSSDSCIRPHKRQKMERIAAECLRGRNPAIISAAIRGPLGEQWTNPWSRKELHKCDPSSGGEGCLSALRDNARHTTDMSITQVEKLSGPSISERPSRASVEKRARVCQKSASREHDPPAGLTSRRSTEQGDTNRTAAHQTNSPRMGSSSRRRAAGKSPNAPRKKDSQSRPLWHDKLCCGPELRLNKATSTPVNCQGGAPRRLRPTFEEASTPVHELSYHIPLRIHLDCQSHHSPELEETHSSIINPFSELNPLLDRAERATQSVHHKRDLSVQDPSMLGDEDANAASAADRTMGDAEVAEAVDYACSVLRESTY